MTYVFEEALEAAASVKHVAKNPEVGVILGSGLGDFATQLRGTETVPYARIPNFPPARVGGHAGQLLFATFGGVRIAVLSGRIHMYEGYSLDKVTLATRTLALLGIKALIVTNASGGIREDLRPGTLMMLKDHINLMGTNPLIGPKDPRLGPRFVDLTEAYDRGLRRALQRASKSSRVPVSEGVYAAVSGPSYETPAEIRMMEIIGADAIGMSTVPEVIVANQMGVKVAGISCIANRAAGLSSERLSHEEVMQVTERVSKKFCRLLARAIPQVAQAARPKTARRRRRRRTIQEQRSVGIRFKGGKERR